MSKKQIVQIGSSLFIFYLYLFFLGNTIIFQLFNILLFSALYIINNNKNHIFEKYLRIIFYFIMIYFIYNFLYYLPVDIHIFRLFNYTSVEMIQRLFFDNFWYLLYVLIISAVLLFNKPANSRKFKIWKFQFSL